MFYGLQSLSLLFLCLTVGDFYRHAFQCSVALRPTWLPRRPFLILHKHHVYLPICYSLAPLLALVALLPTHRPLRVLVALVVSVYQLVESSVTLSHRDYLMVYNAWGLALLPEEYALGLALGLCVTYITCSGLAKLFIGGGDWVRPETMRSILRLYSTLSVGGPWSLKANQWVCDHDIVAGATSCGTLLFECVAVPLALAMPSGSRIILGVGMLLLHAGIFVAQSTVIGVFFLPNVASYVLGFGAAVDRGSAGWFCAALTCGLSLGSVAVRRRLLPEDWPVSPVALFGWSGKQWDVLFALFATGQTRLILTTEDVWEPLGCFVVEKQVRGSTVSELPVVFSAWDLCLGETTLQNDILEALDFRAMAQEQWDATSFVRSVEAWLMKGQRLLVKPDGQPLLRAYFVEVAEDGTVSGVLASGTPPERCALLGSTHG